MIESEFITIQTPCDTCKGSGEVTGLVLTGRHFFDPYEEQTVNCGDCRGLGYIEKEVCEACALEESGCKCLEAAMEDYLEVA
jgi:DnaJ-class molecular chaperone